ncbi:zinc finger MYM-type protein 1-like [Hydra vulgaris]|uniref:zinc finger MYM-type protein 1-like n=1 Tax=Hydra vulgaris TaxID=6087 RepID=UPI0032EA2D5A
MSSQTRQLLVERGPNQIKEFEFPINKGKRRFLPSYYSKVLSNGEVVERSWLMYSIASDAVFCFCCILFDNSSDISDWPKKGYSDWKNPIRALTMHEKSVNHRNALRAWKELEIRLKQKKTIDAEYQRIMDMELQHWRGVIKRIMPIIKLLASQCLAFRGSTEHLFQPNNGNFLKLVELLSEFDLVMEEHIRRGQRESDKWSVTYLSNNIQDELINLMGNSILRKIVEITKIAKHFSIIADCTPDVSHYEQLSLTIRVVTFNSIQNKYEIAEFIIGFFEASDSTGEGLAKLILTHLEKLGFELKWLRGQGYDNGANMKGVRKGVQNRILEKYPRAFYVPCACHSLNLVVNDAASSTTETTFFFSIVLELYTFFSGSTKRREVLKKYVSQLTLKPLSAIRSLEFILSVENETDINANDLREELRDVSRMLPYSTKPFDVLNYLCQNRLISLYPNTVVALRILLTLPVSVASGERSFSKLKLIKNYLRSSIGQTKLKNLALISIESAMASTLDYTSVINKFAKVKVRRVKLVTDVDKQLLDVDTDTVTRC